jgi:hypothetical protein
VVQIAIHREVTLARLPRVLVWFGLRATVVLLITRPPILSLVLLDRQDAVGSRAWKGGWAFGLQKSSFGTGPPRRA